MCAPGSMVGVVCVCVFEWELDREMLHSRTDAELDRLRLPWAEAEAAVDAAQREMGECRYRARVAADEALSAAEAVTWNRFKRTWIGGLEQLHAENVRLHAEIDRLHAERP